MCCSNVKLLANTGVANINTANSNLNGSGSIATVLTAGAGGCTIKKITVKATSSNSQGMVRFFLFNGVSYFLYTEVEVPANVQTGVEQAFAAAYLSPINLRSGWSLCASTENADSFNIIAVGSDWESCSCA